MEKKDMYDQIDRFLLDALERIEPPHGSKENTLILINVRLQRLRRNKLWSFVSLGLASFVALVYSTWFLIIEWKGMETSHYLKLIFTDTATVLENFYNWLLLMGESLPFTGLLMVISVSTILSIVVWKLDELMNTPEGIIFQELAKGGKA